MEVPVEKGEKKKLNLMLTGTSKKPGLLGNSEQRNDGEEKKKEEEEKDSERFHDAE